MEKVQWKVEGMDCNTCAINIHKYLEKQGMTNVKVNFATGDVIFDTTENFAKEKISTGIEGLGYSVVNDKEKKLTTHNSQLTAFLSTHLQRFWFCLPFTVLLMLHMIPGVHIHWLMNHWVQLALTIPVYIVGMSFFGIPLRILFHALLPKKLIPMI